MAICSKGFLWKINPRILRMPTKTKRSGEHKISHIFPSSNHRQINRNPAETLLQPGTCATGSLRTRGLGMVISLRTLLKRRSIYRTIPMGLHGIVHVHVTIHGITILYYLILYNTILKFVKKPINDGSNCSEQWVDSKRASAAKYWVFRNQKTGQPKLSIEFWILPAKFGIATSRNQNITSEFCRALTHQNFKRMCVFIKLFRWIYYK